MARGIHRFVVDLRRDVVKVRAQSVSLRGQTYTVGSVQVAAVGSKKADKKSAAAEGIRRFFPEAV